MTRPELDIDPTAIDQLAREITTQMLLAGTRSVRETTRKLEQEFERLTALGVPGQAGRAWASNVYPRGDRPAYEPVGEVFGKGGRRTQGMLSFWTAPGTVRPLRGRYLAVPLKAATATSAGKAISPRQWEGIYRTKLRPFKSRNGQLLLVADGAIDGVGHFMTARRGGERRRGGQNVSATRTVPIFALIATLAHRNTVSLDRALAEAERYLAAALVRRIGNIGG